MPTSNSVTLRDPPTIGGSRVISKRLQALLAELWRVMVGSMDATNPNPKPLLFSCLFSNRISVHMKPTKSISRKIMVGVFNLSRELTLTA